MPPVFSSLDLFSGLGGNAHALKSLAAPALYCEIDPAAAKLLQNAMKRGFINTAPVHGDIRTLMATQAYARAKATRPLLVSASWPCQGCSKLGKRKGMDDSRSGLLRELCAVILDALPDVAVFENVPDVVSNGSLEHMKEALGDAYTIKHTLLKASDFGYGHERRRLFAVLVRKGFELKLGDFAPEPLSNFLPCAEEPPRTIAAKGELWASQIKAFGNSIVPACMYYATLQLLGFPVPPVPGMRSYDLLLDPAAYTPPRGATRSPRLKEDGLVQKPIAKKLWATPRASDSSGCHVLTHRASHDLSTMIRFERGTPDEGRGWSMNPAWLAWLMGFPLTFTDGPPPGAAGAPPALPPLPPPPGDVVITCGSDRFHAHRVILELRAPGLAEALTASQTVSTVGPEAMRLLLDWAYYNTVPAGLEAKQLGDAAAAFKMARLAELCEAGGGGAV